MIDLEAAVFAEGTNHCSRRSVAGIGTRCDTQIVAGVQARTDRFDDALCAFVRCTAEAGRVAFGLAGRFCLERPAAGGWIASPTGTNVDWVYWCPMLPRQRRLSAQLHITDESDAEIAGFRSTERGLQFALVAGEGHANDCVIWRLPRRLADELRNATALEQQPYFLLGSHTAYRRPADLYRHMAFGAIYEDRFSWPHQRRICSENDAHALYLVLAGMYRATGKSLLALLQRQIVLSVLARQDEDGAFRHGEWTDDLEVHYRLHCSAMHLMMDSLADFPSTDTKASLARAAAFLQSSRSPLKQGVWFVHDELELSEESMRKAPFRWVRSRALGKSPSNMLVLNTHLDTTIALDRYAEVTGDRQYESDVAQAVAATRLVLGLHPADWLYKLVFRPIRLTLLPSKAQAQLPFAKRVAKRIGWKYLAPNLHRLKACFPRLVMPGGYVDRAVPLESWAFHYLTVNLMDLVRHSRRFAAPEVDEAIAGALRFTHESGVLDRWSELSYERYAIGFWAEALVLYCLAHPEAGLEAWLADAVQRLDDLGMGLPPSALGANEEALAAAERVPCFQPPSPAVRLVNLSGPGGGRFLLVNCGISPVLWEGHDDWKTARLEIPPRGWLLTGPVHEA